MGKQEQEQEINLADIFYLLLTKLHILILFAILGGLAGFVVAKFLLPVKYSSSISIYVNNATSGSAATDGKINSADIYASQALASTYIVILEDDIVYEEVSDLLLADYELADLEKVFAISYKDGEAYISPGQIKSLVTIASVNETEVISISATTENPQLSADICTYIAQIAPELLTRTTHAGSVESIGSAKVPGGPSSPNVNRITLIGLLAGMVLAAAIVIISDLMDNRISFADDFRKKFEGIPVLAEIPDMSESEKGGKRR